MFLLWYTLSDYLFVEPPIGCLHAGFWLLGKCQPLGLPQWIPNNVDTVAGPSQ